MKLRTLPEVFRALAENTPVAIEDQQSTLRLTDSGFVDEQGNFYTLRAGLDILFDTECYEGDLCIR